MQPSPQKKTPPALGCRATGRVKRYQVKRERLVAAAGHAVKICVICVSTLKNETQMTQRHADKSTARSASWREQAKHVSLGEADLRGPRRWVPLALPVGAFSSFVFVFFLVLVLHFFAPKGPKMSAQGRAMRRQRQSVALGYQGSGPPRPERAKQGGRDSD